MIGMLEAALAALAATGGTTLVAAMTTSAWQAASTGITKLFTRTDMENQTAIHTQLERTVRLIERSSDPDKDRAQLAGQWETELRQLLEEHPRAEDELRTLIARIIEKLPPQQTSWVQNNIARDQSSLFAALAGNVVVYQAAPDLSSVHPSAREQGDGGAP
jgi:hypothetical protein